jgi:hypothetical protein
MARYIRFPGLASIVVVEKDDEIEALIGRPDLDRTYRPEGPPLNRLLIARLRHALFRDGRALLSFRPGEDAERAAAQKALTKRLDALAQSGPCDHEAVVAMAAYVTTGTGRDAALAALAYATAYPFLPPNDAAKPPPFELARFARLFQLYERLQLARSPWKGLPSRLLGLDRHAAREILQSTGGDDYGLHAVGITLANSVLILEHLRALFAARPLDKTEPLPFDWRKVRTAPAAVTRQNRMPCEIPGIPGKVPGGSLILLKMRQALRPESPAGYEFASKHWSFCPASRYVEAIFASVYNVARNRVQARDG